MPQPVTVEYGMEDLRSQLTDAVDLARHGTPVRVTYYKRLMCIMMPPAMAERCLAELDHATLETSTTP